jgi:hypothetical protein
VGNTRILDVKVVQVSHEPSLFTIHLADDGTSAALRFDFLDHDHGAVMQVIHTGSSGSALTVTGTIKGAGTPVKRTIRGAYLPLPTSAAFDRRLKPSSRRRITRACEVAVVSTWLLLLGGALVYWLNPVFAAAIGEMWTTFNDAHHILATMLTVAAIVVGLFSFFVTMELIDHLGATMLPIGLMILVDDPLQKRE